MRSTKDVIENHIRRFRGGNLEGILDDYSQEAMLFTPAGLLRGRGEIEALFQESVRGVWKTRCFGYGAHGSVRRRICLPGMER